MGCRITSNNPCPNCGKFSSYKKDDGENVLLICMECGLKLFAEKRIIVLDSYIDKSIIGKSFNIFGKDLFNPTKNENIIARESILYG